MFRRNIIDLKVVASFIIFSLTLATVVLLQPNDTGISKIRNYPATVCPQKLSDGTSTSVLPSRDILVREIPSKKNLLKPAKSALYLSLNPLLVDGYNSTSINVTRSQSRSLATVTCAISNSEQWFVGGSGTVSSRASLVVTNSGLSLSVVDLVIYSANPAPSLVTKKIRANSSKRIYLDTLAPGESSIVVRVVTKSGRVTTFLYDQRERGLQKFGADFVSPSNSPEKTVVIPAISSVPLVRGRSNQMLRVLTPGKVGANIRAQIVSNDGSFAPIALDNITLESNVVADIAFKPILKSRNFSLVIKSDQPIVAAAKSSGVFEGVNEFTWSTAASQLEDLAMHLGGLQPDFVFTGKKFEVRISWMLKNRKILSKTLSGDDLATWRPKNGILWVSFLPSEPDIFGGIIFKEQAGLSSLPLVAGAQLESAAVPNLDARVIARE